MAQDNIVVNNDRLIAGINKVCQVIRPTYGAAGGNIVLEETVYPFHSVRNDGKAIVDKIKLADPIENIGANIIREVGDKADKDSGDGRKTTMILVESILRASKDVKALPLEVKKSLDECVPIVLRSIDEQKRSIGVENIKSVATISSESEKIGQVIEEIYKKIGKDGIVELDTSPLPDTFYEITEGVRFRGAKMLGLYSQTEPGKAIYKKPKILITKDKISTVDQLENLFVKLSAEGIKELVIYCEEIDMAVAARLAFTHMQGAFKTLVINSPKLWKDWFYEDLAVITGARIVDSKEGLSFANLEISDLGTCEKIISNDEETRVIGIKPIEGHLQRLRKRAEVEDQLNLRLSWLQTSVAILKVGANSESELSYTIKKAKDACAASHLALKDGVVAGGGVALFRSSFDLPITPGGAILRYALQQPMDVIVSNSGKDLKGKMTGNLGMDARTGEMVDMFEAGIIDPAIVIKNAVKNAVSIAGIILTSKGVIMLPNENTGKM